MLNAPPRPPVSSRTRPGPRRVLALVACLAVGTAGCQAVSTTAPGPSVQARDRVGPGGPSEADGRLPHGATVLDDDLAGIGNLDPDLADALRQATVDAADAEIEIQVSSGWRSAAYQNHLLEQAVGTYGSEAEAARWVATPQTSLHVSGEAVDIAPYDAIDWLSRFGGAYGLCQVYANESWHFELRPDAPAAGCPAQYPDPTRDPRMLE